MCKWRLKAHGKPPRAGRGLFRDVFITLVGRCEGLTPIDSWNTVVARGFIPVGLRSSPIARCLGVSGGMSSQFLGLLRSPAGINPLATVVCIPGQACQQSAVSSQQSAVHKQKRRDHLAAFLCVGSAQVLAEQCVVQLAVAQDPDDFLVIVEHQFVAGLVADLQRVAHADVGVHQGRTPAQVFH
ncbi:hypothetical protein SAMN03159304_02299 [Pseudomonas sp. NFACC24-1]|nr:hypothetical protein SAMN03159304_02299 [Pseudomonas sp. NFACC24-1]